MMKFFPLEAVQLVQPYEWTFQAYSPTLTNLKLRSNLTHGSRHGVSYYKLHNPPPRGISKKPDLLYGENKRLVALGYEKFIAEVLQKIIEETRSSMKRIEVISQVHSKENTPLSSPTSSGWTSASSPTSELSYTVASSPAKAVAGVGKSFSGSTSPSMTTSLDVTLPTGTPRMHIDPSAPVLGCGTKTTKDIVPINLRRCEEGEIMDDDFRNLEAVDNRISKLIDSLSRQPRKKHLLKESWRWATKRKEKLFKTILKKKYKGEAPLDGERSDTPCSRCIECDGSRECRKIHGCLEGIPNLLYSNSSAYDGAAEDAKDLSKDLLVSKHSENSSQVCPALQIWEFPTSVNQDTSARTCRPNVRDLFTTDSCVLNTTLPTPRMTYSEDTRSASNPSTLPSPASIEARVPKANLPKLSINTQLVSPTQLPLVQTTKEPISNKAKLASLPLIVLSPHQPNSAARVGTHEWYRAKINSPSSRSPDDTGVLGVGDSTIREYLRRGRERERANFDEPEGALSPICIKDWAARGLIAKVKRARDSMRGVYTAVEECDDNDTISSSGEDTLGMKENLKLIITQEDVTEQL